MKNIILLTVDCLRADYCVHGENSALTPNINKLAQDSTVFDRAFAHGPCTFASFPSILSSTYPLMCGGYPHLSPERVTLQEVLARQGFVTAGFSNNPYLSKFFGYGRGFQVFEDFTSTGVKKRLKFLAENSDFLARRVSTKIRHGFAAQYAPADIIVERAVRFIKKNRTSSFFLWSHFMDAHFPYHPVRRYLTVDHSTVRKVNSHLLHSMITKDEEVELRALYGSAVRYVDENVGLLVDFLKDSHRLDNTAIVLTADHGEEFFEHQSFGHSGIGKAAGRTAPRLYDELLHVPMLWYTNGMLKTHNVSTLMGQNAIAPSILSMFGFEKPSNYVGLDILGDIKNIDLPQWVISECSHSRQSSKVDRRYLQYSIRTDKWKFIAHPEIERYELYDISNDSCELNELAQQNAATCETFRRFLRGHMEFEARTSPTEFNDAIDASLLGRLKALGYE